MKKIVSLIFVTAFLLTACSGDQGPMGPPGVPGNTGNTGADGGIIASSAFEKTVNFNSDNNFSFTQKFGFEVLDSDVTLVYILWETVDGKDVWRLLPQTILLDQGLLFYNFDFTLTDVRFFLDADFDLNLLGSGDTQNQVFRVVVVPADFVNSVDVSDINSVIRGTDIQSFDIK